MANKDERPALDDKAQLEALDARARQRDEWRRRHVLMLTFGDTLHVIEDRLQSKSYDGFNNHDLVGREVTLVGFAVRAWPRTRARIEGGRPGYYLDRSHAYVKDRGTVRRVPTRLLRFPEAVWQERLEQHRATIPALPEPEPEFVGELPDTGFWEGDLVTIKPLRYLPPLKKVPFGTFPEHPEAVMIAGARYQHFRDVVDHMGAEPTFSVTSHLSQIREGEYLTFQLNLVARGNLWREAHGEPLVFHDLAEEALFFLHQAKVVGEVRIRVNSSAELELASNQAREMIRLGRGHAFRWGWDLSGCGTDDSCVIYEFQSAELGARLRTATLEQGFRIPGDERMKF